jgi:hypothetical protein
MRGKSPNHVTIVVVLLFLPAVLQAQELSADVVIHKTDGTEARGRLYRGKNAIRLEPPEEGHGAIRGGVVIYDLARRVTYSLNPTMKTYVERPSSAEGGPVSLFVPQKDSPCALLPQVSKGASCQKVGAEGVSGHNTEKWQATQSRGGKIITEYAWVESELHLALKWQDFRGEVGQLENIHLGPQPASLFVLPPDYRKMEMPSRARSNP